MKNIVLIPAWRRDDFLSVTLDYIKEANNSENNCYVFLIDRGYSESVLKVAESFPLCKEIRITPPHRYRGNSYNILEGYKFALQAAQDCESSLVYLIEEDIWVGKDFFDFHEQVHKQFDPYCVSGVKCQNDSTVHPDFYDRVYYHHTFQSLGISWKTDKLSEVVKHAKPEYYRNMRGYIKSLAPYSKYGEMWTEQDGLINRLVELSAVKCLYPFVGRAYHAGFFGYNRRGVPLDGTLNERVKLLKNMSAADMNDRALEYKDIKPVSLSNDYKVTDFMLE